MSDHFISEDTYNNDLLGLPNDYSPAEREADARRKIESEFTERKARAAELEAGRKDYWKHVPRDNDPADGENKQGWDARTEGE